MSVRPILRRPVRVLLSAAMLVFGACSEPTVAPAAVEQAQFAPNVGPQVTHTAVFADAPTATPLAPAVIKFSRWAPALATYDTSFAVVVGTASTHTVAFKGSSINFLKLEIPAGATFFDANGAPLPAGSKVAVRTQIDPVNAAVRFGPHGTQFSKTPATVSLNYLALDLGGYRPDQLAIWYQPDDLTDWDRQATKIDVAFWWLSVPIQHFSNYAVSY